MIMRRCFIQCLFVFGIIFNTQSQNLSQYTELNLVDKDKLAEHYFSSPILLHQHPREYIAPSPSVASLGVFGQVPVGMYTGTAMIHVPLLDFSYKDMQPQERQSKQKRYLLEESAITEVPWFPKKPQMG